MATIFGTSRADRLRGTVAADTIHGLGGNDDIRGVEGRDLLFGDDGRDRLDGAAGHDTLYGGFGADTLIGDTGWDWLDGGAGNDRLLGGLGADTLVGGLGNDTALGGAGDDVFRIGPIVRQIDAFTLTPVDYGKDVLHGGAGTDTLVVDGPVFFVEDAELVGSGWGRDMGAPPVRANLMAGTLRIGESDNRSTLVSIENIQTGSGDDSINGTAGDNVIRAGDGANVVYALSGDDTIVGGSKVYADIDDHSNVEILHGGPGDDVIYGMGANAYSTNDWRFPAEDVLVGGGGNDTLYGGGAIQTMTGGSGHDVFVVTDQGMYNDDEWLDMSFLSRTTITDYDRGEDLIRFQSVGQDLDLRFVGATSSENLEVGDLGYHRDGNDTVLEARFSESGSDDIDLLTVVLRGYTGPLSASDFDLA